ncbi:MAG: DUF4112 domain-containing protein [Proteobacteria bacterium]|nr:DUF4112 domain-containing protein [Pseudomonadota bacterium]
MTDAAWNSRAGAPDRAGLERKLRRLRRLATLMDAAFVIPGTTVRVGWDPLIGLIPGAGDALTAALSLYIVGEAWRLGVPAGLLARMVVNIAIDFGLGVVPVAGDVFDALWRDNLMNVALIERYFGVPPQGPSR